jgi:hypothetical protein
MKPYEPFKQTHTHGPLESCRPKSSKLWSICNKYFKTIVNVPLQQ